MPRRAKTGLPLTLLALTLPATPLPAEEPSNAQLYDLYLKLQEELAATRAENRALREEMNARNKTATTEPTPARVEGKKPPKDPATPPPAVKEQPIPLQAEFKKSYLTFRSADGHISYKIDGRIMLDAGFVKNTKETQNPLHSNTEIRLASLAIKTTLYRDWEGKFDLNLSDPGGFKVRDMTLAYTGLPRTSFKIGNHKPYFSMEELSSSRWVTFLESGLPVLALAPGRRIGMSATHWEESYSAGITLFGDSWNKDAATDNNPEGFGWSARVVGRPFVQDHANKVLHLGANYLVQQPQSSDRLSGDQFSISTRPEADFIDYKFLDTGKLKNTEDATTWGLEWAGKWDRFYAQSEYMRTTLHRNNNQPEPTFQGWYAMVAAFLTDDSRLYNLEDGHFGAVLPNGPWGAVELAARYSILDLNDAGILGGEARNATVGLNWYVNNNIIFRANYIRADQDAYATGAGKWTGDDTLNIFGARMEYLF